jgi:hypothetical protein
MKAALVQQDQQHYAAFLAQRAARLDYELYLTRIEVDDLRKRLNQAQAELRAVAEQDAARDAGEDETETDGTTGSLVYPLDPDDDFSDMRTPSERPVQAPETADSTMRPERAQIAQNGLLEGAHPPLSASAPAPAPVPALAAELDLARERAVVEALNARYGRHATSRLSG